jgi:hypothetical protein
VGAAQRILGTGVRIAPWTPDDLDWAEIWSSPFERRRVRAKIDGGLAVMLICQVFADLDDRGDIHRIAGSSWASSELYEPGEDATTRLLEQAFDGGRQHLGDLYGDLRITEFRVRRWDLYSAPYAIELDPELERQLTLG